MPSPCFISHAYADNEMVRDLVKRLPKRVSPVIFPPISVTPEQRVSDDLVGAILECPGLVYIASGSSAESVWVTFERDYALRAGKLVFSYAGKTHRFAADRSAPLDLPVFPSYSREDMKRVHQMTHFMKEERHFDIWTTEDIKPGTDFRQEHEGAIEARLSRGGYVVAFISDNAVRSDFVKRELAIAAEKWPEQILPALLDPVDLSLLPAALLMRTPVVIHQDFDHGGAINWNGVDDLIVRIHDLVYRNSLRRSEPT
jgi:hypothetical protein